MSCQRVALFFAVHSIFEAMIFGNLIKLVRHAFFAFTLPLALFSAGGSRHLADSRMPARSRDAGRRQRWRGRRPER